MKYEMMCVRQFHLACDVPARAETNVPTITDEEVRLRLRLSNEELGELMQALIAGDHVETADGIGDSMYVVAGSLVQFGVEPKVEHAISAAVELLKDAHRAWTTAVQAQNYQQMAVCASLVQIVCYGIGGTFGVPYKQVWDAIHQSNMEKVDPKTGKVVKDAGGKVLKPTQWPEPQPWTPPTERIKAILGR